MLIFYKSINYKMWVIVFSIVLLPFTVFSQCISEETVRNIAEDNLSLPIKGIKENISVKDAYCIQSLLVNYLKQKGGEIVGYKVGFTGKKTQERFKISHPAYGVLFATLITLILVPTSYLIIDDIKKFFSGTLNENA